MQISEEIEIKKEQIFLIEEYKALRTEIDNSIQHSRRVIYLNVVAIGLIWSFILSTENELNPIIGWLPLVICMLSGLYALAIRKDIKRIGDYLLYIENIFLENRELGWEKYLRKKEIGWKYNTEYWETLFWITLFVVNIVGAVYPINANKINKKSSIKNLQRQVSDTTMSKKEQMSSQKSQ